MRVRHISLLPLIAPAAFGYIRLALTDSSGTVLYNRPDSTGIQFYVNKQIAAGQVSTATGKSVAVVSAGSDPVSAIQAALASWSNVSAPALKFLPLKTTPSEHDSQDYQHTVAFANASDLSVIGGAIGVTLNAVVPQSGQLSNGANVTRGDIIDSDILLNSGLNFSTDGSTPYDIQAVVTHELGHALGLNHSGLLGSTMFPYSAVGTSAVINQRFLSSDELAFAAAAFPNGSRATGTIAGKIVAADGSAVKAALVTILDIANGNSISVISGADGTYTLPVAPASYLIYAEPLSSTSIVQSANIIALDPGQVTSNFQPTILGGANSPTSVNVGAGTTVSPVLTVTAGSSSLTLPFIAFGQAGGSGDIHTLNGVGGPRILASTGPVDIAFLSGGFDGTEKILVLGQGIQMRSGSQRIDKTINFSAGPLVRATLDMDARSTPTLASIFVSKPTGTLALSGFLVVVPPKPTFVAAAVGSATGVLPTFGAVSPGGITSIYDIPSTPNLGPSAPVSNGGYDAYGKLPGNLSGVSVTFDGVPAPLFFVAGSQINLQVPFEVAGKTSTNVVVTWQGSSSDPVAVPVVAAQPAFFMLNATDPFAANSDYAANPTPNSASNPAARATVLSVYGTGVGKVSYNVPTGLGAPGPPGGYSGGYNCTLGNKNIGVPFAGWTPTSVGLAQWSFVIPADAGTGAQTLKCTDSVSGASTQPATIYLK